MNHFLKRKSKEQPKPKERNPCYRQFREQNNIHGREFQKLRTAWHAYNNNTKVKLTLEEYHKRPKYERSIKGKPIKYLRMKRIHNVTLATPKWVNFEELYRIYNECPKGMHVDHIIPLSSDKVCGLHVPWNLQYVTPEYNSNKRNKFNLINKSVIRNKKFDSK